jgi:hypothetical protein
MKRIAGEVTENNPGEAGIGTCDEFTLDSYRDVFSLQATSASWNPVSRA